MTLLNNLNSLLSSPWFRDNIDVSEILEKVCPMYHIHRFLIISSFVLFIAGCGGGDEYMEGGDENAPAEPPLEEAPESDLGAAGEFETEPGE